MVPILFIVYVVHIYKSSRHTGRVFPKR
jgi:hypothetical protein